METETLTNPPIIEALIELRFSPSDKVTLSQLEDFADKESKMYPTKESIYSQSVEIAFKGHEHTSKVDGYPSGYRLKNVNENRIIVCAIDRLVVSVQPPYVSWPALREIAQDTYKSYSGTVSHGKMTRIGMRYINKVKIPLEDKTDLEQYIRTLPNIPKSDGIPEVLQSFETILVIPFEDIPLGAATVKQVLLPPEIGPEQSRFLPFILDIDIFRELKDPPTDSSIWPLFDKFRDKKNKLFFASLTEKALEPYR